MEIKQRASAFVHLGEWLNNQLNGTEILLNDELEKAVNDSFLYNGWFTRSEVIRSLKGIAHMLRSEQVENVASTINPDNEPKTIALIMAGNIPAVGFHDLFCTLISGHRALIKCSSDDSFLIPLLCKQLCAIEPEFKGALFFAEQRIQNFNAVIATGSTNSSRYFEYYFGKYPNIIRKNRNSVAVLNGSETYEELNLLGHDLFDYYGLGCRNVSHLYLPEGYDLTKLFEAVYTYSFVIDNKKYANNYDYNRALYLLDGQTFLENNFLILKEENALASPVAVVFYSYYNSYEFLLSQLLTIKNELQCVVSAQPIHEMNSIPLGKSQLPDLNDFADGINTISFLNKLP